MFDFHDEPNINERILISQPCYVLIGKFIDDFSFFFLARFEQHAEIEHVTL